MTKVFVSYSRQDQTFAHQLAHDLSEIGFDLWIDSINIRGGNAWREEIAEGIRQADTVIVCLSPDSVESEWVRREIFLARSLQKYIVPVIKTDCLTNLSKFDETKGLLELQFIDFEKNDYSQTFPLLRDALSRYRLKNTSHRIFAQSDSSEFMSYIEDLAHKAHQLIFVGTGLHMIQRDTFAMEIMTKGAQGGCNLEIYLADPSSPQVQTRLVEEEAGVMKPWRISSKLHQIRKLLEIWESYGRPSNISIKLFTHYPTFALLILDDEYFMYPYGYLSLGNFSPVLHFSKNELNERYMVDFIDKQYHLIKDSAVNAEKTFNIRSGKSSNVEELYSFALFFIPPQETSLYKFGTQVVGYDVRERKLQPSPWEGSVGNARNFGFHLTLCDALYFLNKAEVRKVYAEVAFLVREFSPFELCNLIIQPHFPGPNMLSIKVDDPSGNLEALHHELVHRVYRHALGSNYSLGLANLENSTDNPRTKLMMKRYKAPYILQRFLAHFTLLSGTVAKLDRTQLELEEIFSEQVQERTILVGHLAVMARSESGSAWIIEDEITLGD